MRDVIGQPQALRILQRLMQQDRLPHALLFFGPEGAGAEAMAVAFARALHCEKGGVLPCDVCGNCRKTSALNHPDFAMLFPFSARTKDEAIRAALLQVIADPYGYALPDDNTTLSVDQVRGLQRQFTYGTLQGRWRTIVILHADHMRPEAANALLKTLEEPPPRSLMILTASHPEALLPTIISRCQFLKFPALSPQVVCEALENKKALDKGAAELIGRMCGGSFRRALEMVGGNVGDVLDRAFRFLEALTWGNDGRTYAALEQLSGERQDVMAMLKGTEIWLRDALLFLGEKNEHIANVQRLQDVERLASAFDVVALANIAKKIESLREMNIRNVNLHLGLVSLWRQVRTEAHSV